MRILVDLNHPAHFHLFKNAIEHWKSNGRHVVITSRHKDVLTDLIAAKGWTQHILSKAAASKVGMALELAWRDWCVMRLAMKEKIDVLMGTSVCAAHIGRLLKKKSWVFTEDDADVTPLFAKLTFPHATRVITPECFRGEAGSGHVKVASYHELAYLHPNNFKPDLKILDKYKLKPREYILVRFSALKAHHDEGIRGISKELYKKIKGELTDFRLIESVENAKSPVEASDIHHVLAYAKLAVSDSQTMTAEAAVLGVPSIRINDFKGRISYLNELESRFGLTRSFLPDEEEKILNYLKEILQNNDLENVFRANRNRMLSEKTDLTDWILAEVDRLEGVS